jgi:hypothetical protein
VSQDQNPKVAVAITSLPYATQREYDATSGFKPIPPQEYVAGERGRDPGARPHRSSNGSRATSL